MAKEQQISNQFDQLVLVPKGLLEEIQKDQREILNYLQQLPKNQKPKGTVLNNYIPEDKAKEMLGKGTTWFWQKRKDGSLKFKKVGNKIYYPIESIEGLFNVDVSDKDKL